MGNILIGNIEIQGAWVGNADVSAIWLGNVLVWPTNWHDSLPLGELSYVTSDGKKTVNEQETSMSKKHHT